MVKFPLNKHKKNYLKLIRILLENDKKIATISVISLVVGFFFLLSFSALSQTIINTNTENVLNTYGDFLIVVPEVDKDVNKALKNLDNRFIYTYYGIIDNIEYNGTKIKIGTMDEKTGEHLAIRKIKGQWPKDFHQIVVEEYLLETLGLKDTKLPVTVTLPTGDGQIQYEITGVINNYSYLLSPTVDSNYPFKAYPSIICGEKSAPVTDKSAIILSKNIDYKTVSDTIFELFDRIPTDMLCANHHIDRVYKETRDFILIRLVYLIIINVLLFIEQILIIKTFFVRNKKTLSIFSAFGLSNSQKLRVFFGWLLTILGSSLLIGYSISMLVGKTLLQQVFHTHNKYYQEALFEQLLLETSLLIIIMIISFICFKIMSNTSIAKGLTYFSVKRKRKYNFQKICIRIILLQSVCMLFTTASFCFADDLSAKPENKNYSLLSNSTTAIHYLKNYGIRIDTNSPFPLELLDQLQNYKKYANTFAYAETRNSTLLLPEKQTDPYLKKYLATNEKIQKKDKVLWKQVSNQAKKYNTIDIDDFNVIVLSNNDYEQLLKKTSSKALTKTPVNNLSCILQLPNYNKNKNKISLKENDTLLLGGIQGNQKEVKFYSEQFTLASIIETYSNNSDNIQMIVCEDVAKSSHLIYGYNEISIELDKNTPSLIQKELEAKIAFWMAPTQGGLLESNVKDYEKEVFVNNFTSILTKSMMIFSVLGIIIYISLSTYIEWKQNLHEYGVLRSFGMSYKALQRNQFCRYQYGLVISGFLCYFVAMKLFKYNHISSLKIIIAIMITSVATFLCKVILYFINQKKSIRSMVQTND